SASTGTITVSVADGGEDGAAPATLAWPITVVSQAHLCALPDVNGNGSPDQALLVKTPAGVSAYVTEGAGATLIRTVTFASAYTAAGLACIDDLNGNGTPELAALGKSTSTGAIQVQIRDAGSGALIRNIPFLGPGYQPVAVASATSGTTPLLAVLGKDATAGTVRVQLKNALDGSQVKTINFFSPTSSAQALALATGLQGANSVQVAVLGKDAATGIVHVQLRDASSGALINTINFLTPAFSAERLAIIPAPAKVGGAAIAVLGRDPVAGVIRVQLRDAFSDAVDRTLTFFGAHYEPEDLAIVDGAATPQVAVLARNLDTGVVKVQMLDSAGGTALGTVTFPGPSFVPMQLVRVTDGSGAQGLAVLSDGATLRVQTRSASDGSELGSATYP
ncbi:MAG TPA: hypothetical protein VHE37_08570, partial [Nevskiaceae bacterium]|nr:hypothetical protein [Nevskiaceae bacterium]